MKTFEALCHLPKEATRCTPRQDSPFRKRSNNENHNSSKSSSPFRNKRAKKSSLPSPLPNSLSTPLRTTLRSSFMSVERKTLSPGSLSLVHTALDQHVVTTTKASQEREEAERNVGVNPTQGRVEPVNTSVQEEPEDIDNSIQENVRNNTAQERGEPVTEEMKDTKERQERVQPVNNSVQERQERIVRNNSTQEKAVTNLRNNIIQERGEPMTEEMKDTKARQEKQVTIHRKDIKRVTQERVTNHNSVSENKEDAEDFDSLNETATEERKEDDKKAQEPGAVVDLERRKDTGEELIEMSEFFTEKSRAIRRLGGHLQRSKGVGIQQQMAQLRQLLKSARSNAESSSALVFGKAGSGKSFLVHKVLAQFSTPTGGNKFFVVHLQGDKLLDDLMAMREITRQLGVLASLPKGNLESHLGVLLSVLKEGAHADKAKPIVFILDRFELFTKRPKQMLLYNLLDLCQSKDSRIVLIGLTSDLNATSLLEKRVKSRFDDRHIHLSHPTRDELEQIVLERLCLRNQDRWNSHVRQSLEKGTFLARKLDTMHALGFSIGRVLRALQSSMNSAILSPRTLADIEMFEQMFPDAKMRALNSLAIPELLILISLAQMEKRHEHTTANFEMILSQVNTFFRQGSNTSVYRMNKGTLRKALDHLLQLDLASHANASQTISDFTPVRMLVSPDDVFAFVKDQKDLPAAVTTWSLRGLISTQ